MNDEKVVETTSELPARLSDAIAGIPEFKEVKPFMLNHKIGTGAGVFMNGNFRYITKHLYFTPKAVNSSEDEGKSPDISAADTQQQAGQPLQRLRGPSQRFPLRRNEGANMRYFINKR